LGRDTHFGTAEKTVTGKLPCSSSPPLFTFKRRAGSRTLVSNFSAFRRYRFSVATATQSGDASARENWKLANTRFVQTALYWSGAAGDELEPVCRHARPVACSAVSGLLLPLRARATLGELRENLRAAEIRIALVGRLVRQAARAFRGGQSRRWSALAPSRSRRACAPIGRKSDFCLYGRARRLLLVLDGRPFE